MDFIFILHFEGVPTTDLSGVRRFIYNYIQSYFHWRAQCTSDFQVFLLVFCLFERLMYQFLWAIVTKYNKLFGFKYTFIVSQSWRLEVRETKVWAEALKPVDRKKIFLPLVAFCVCRHSLEFFVDASFPVSASVVKWPSPVSVSVSLFFLKRQMSCWNKGPPYSTVTLLCFCSDSVSKYGHILMYCRLELQHNLLGWDTVQPITVDKKIVIINNNILKQDYYPLLIS